MLTLYLQEYLHYIGMVLLGQKLNGQRRHSLAPLDHYLCQQQ